MGQIFTYRMDPACPGRKGLGAEMGWQAGEGQLCSEEQAHVFAGYEVWHQKTVHNKSRCVLASNRMLSQGFAEV